MATETNSPGNSILLQALTKRFDTVSQLSSWRGSLLDAHVDGFSFPYKYVSDSTEVADGVYSLNARGGNGSAPGRWINTNPQVNAREYGAKGDGIADDTVALQAWFSATGRQHLLPAGDYVITSKLVRNNKGSLSLVGAGSGLSKIIQKADDDGISISNTLGGNVGAIYIKGISVDSDSAKTNRNAIYIRSQDYRPGPLLEDIIIISKVVGKQWTKGINAEDCLGVNMLNIQIDGYDLYTGMTGIAIHNSASRTSFEHTLTNVNMRNVTIGVDIYSASGATYGNEGIQFDNINIVGVGQYGIRAICPASSPYIGFRGVHINALGGECLHLENYQQITFNSSNFYANDHSINHTNAARAIYIKNPVIVSGELMCILLNNLPVGIEVAGTGGLLSINVGGSYASGLTDYIKVESTYTAGARFNVVANWTGDTTWGSRTGKVIADPGKRVTTYLTIPFASSEPLDILDPVLRYNVNNDYIWSAVPRISANGQRVGFITTSGVVDASLVDGWLVDNGANDIIIDIDREKLVPGRVIYFKRYENSTGKITIRQFTYLTSGSIPGNIAGPSGIYAPTYNISNDGSRGGHFVFTGGQLISIIGSENVRRTFEIFRSGDGTTSDIVIPHGLDYEPGYYNVVPVSLGARGVFYLTADTTNIAVRYETARTTGTNNLKYKVEVN